MLYTKAVVWLVLLGIDNFFDDQLVVGKSDCWTLYLGEGAVGREEWDRWTAQLPLLDHPRILVFVLPIYPTPPFPTSNPRHKAPHLFTLPPLHHLPCGNIWPPVLVFILASSVLSSAFQWRCLAMVPAPPPAPSFGPPWRRRVFGVPRGQQQLPARCGSSGGDGGAR